MNEFTDKNEQAFLDAFGPISVEPDWKLKSCVTLTQRRYGHPEGVNLVTLMRGSQDPGVSTPHCDRYGHIEGTDPSGFSPTKICKVPQNVPVRFIWTPSSVFGW
jgi:hypothetical protein